jgi:hypothetical protein
MTTHEERLIVKVLNEHQIPTKGGGGTASGSYCVCSCGERNAPRSGLRDDAALLARLHVARCILSALTPPTPATDTDNQEDA